MRILWSLHLYFPDHLCGSERYAHEVNKYLLSRGHEVRVVHHDASKYGIRLPYTYEGIEVHANTKHLDQYRWADVILTHLDYTRLTLEVARHAKKPIVFFSHNDIPYESVKSTLARCSVVYNSQWIADKQIYPHRSIVIPPPVAEWNPTEGKRKYIALISLNENKGGKQLYEIARQMPDHHFLGVIGSYDPQFVQYDLPNVRIINKTTDMQSVYDETKILIMPSKYESWGLTASEAMANGIPVICTPTPGLKENCGDAAIYVDRDDIKGWVKAIKKMNYEKQKAKSLERAKEANRLDQLENFLYEAAGKAHYSTYQKEAV